MRLGLGLTILSASTAGCQLLLGLDGSVAILNAEGGADEGRSSEGGAPDVSAPADASEGEPPFGSSACPPGTTYAEPFNRDPGSALNQIAGTWQWDPTNRILLASPAPTPDLYALAWVGPRPGWRNYDVTVQLRLDQVLGTNGQPLGNSGLLVRVVDPGTGTPPAVNAGDMYYVGIGVGNGAGFVQIGKMQGGVWTLLGQRPSTINIGEWYALEVRVMDGTISASVDGGPSFIMDDATFVAGSIGLRTYYTDTSFGGVTVTCL